MYSTQQMDYASYRRAPVAKPLHEALVQRLHTTANWIKVHKLRKKDILFWPITKLLSVHLTQLYINLYQIVHFVAAFVTYYKNIVKR